MADVDMTGKTVLVTGGNTGIGKHTVIALASMGATLVFTSRNLRKGDVARAHIREAAEGKQVECMELDLASFRSIESFAAAFLDRYERLDVLILNAGLILGERRETEEGFETTLGVNHIGHFYLTQLRRERLEASAPARVVVVASEAHRYATRGLDFDDLMSEKRYRPNRAYGASKLANIYFARELARRLEGTGVTANSLHPGVVRTEFGGSDDMKGLLWRIFVGGLLRPFMISPQRGARTSVYLASAPEVEGKTGGYYVRCKPASGSRAARDDEAARRLWDVTEGWVEQAKATKSTS